MEYSKKIPRKSFHSSKFSDQAIARNFVDIKIKEREACQQNTTLSQNIQPYAAPKPNDSIEFFLQKKLLTKNIFELDKMNIHSAQLESTPWSGDYWPIASGTLGARPFDTEFMGFEGWKERFDYFLENPLHKILNRPDADLVKQLSASEKFELFVNDQNSFLTQRMWLEGKTYYDKTGSVEDWMGICHGWAPASYMTPVPKHAIEIQSPDGRFKTKILPDELKGLISYLWAKNPYQRVHIGGRCTEKEPKENEEGRVIHDDCFDTNPATWHLAILHRIGLEKKSFVMDATYDYEVWNQPVVGYELKYFNPNSYKMTDRIDDAIISYHDFKKDPYRFFRSKEIKKIIGVAMRVGYVVEQSVRDHEIEPPDYNEVIWTDYQYDLELDADGNILGGEWYNNFHPDFLWTPVDGAIPHSPYDNMIDVHAWSGQGPIPEAWIPPAVSSHYYNGQLLTPIIYKLIELSQ
ncbi:MAG: hypothetical protein KDD34_06645 [Bdellovibrionales bacterium]|nr:hypothetical protein [Bdellovibrionales bacterium]